MFHKGKLYTWSTLQPALKTLTVFPTSFKTSSSYYYFYFLQWCPSHWFESEFCWGTGNRLQSFKKYLYIFKVIDRGKSSMNVLAQFPCGLCNPPLQGLQRTAVARCASHSAENIQRTEYSPKARDNPKEQGGVTRVERLHTAMKVSPCRIPGSTHVLTQCLHPSAGSFLPGVRNLHLQQ